MGDRRFGGRGRARRTPRPHLRVALPKARLPDPFDTVLPDAALPERHRFCVECGSPVGRGEAGRAAGSAGSASPATRPRATGSGCSQP
ncbi:hypothetical protein G3I59_39215 [Amycolatopsis rubida]|uniref:Protein kinase G rubredoxin domain-containing protein n=1 Tax=Amycolatopsis rubida TaxID=112413 RepID=A0ABX0C0X9_9PSEU|nr:hypothetical protein [Amycolatopsis rubida]NEC61474.1 hypothetical protein [Amycolatopsis rubida]